MAYVTRENEKFYYEQTGEVSAPRTLLFLHGATMTGVGLTPIVDCFPDYNCINVDLPGHGRSVGETRKTIEEFADAVEFLIRELCEQGVMSGDVSVIGYSMGGCIALELALRRIPQIKRIVVLSSGANLKNNTPLISEFEQRGVEQFNALDLFANIFGKRTSPQQRELLMRVLADTRVDDRIGFSDLLTACQFDKLAECAGLRLPALVICGDEDKIVPPIIPINLWECMPNASLTVLPYRGHTAIYEQTEEVKEIIRDFLQYNR